MGIENIEELFQFSEEHSLKHLPLHLADFQLKAITTKPNYKFSDLAV